MPGEGKNKNQIYHIDADILLNYNWSDDEDQKRAVQGLFNKSNSGDLEIKINTFALGEVLQNIIKKHNENSGDIYSLIDLYKNEKLKIFELNDIDIDHLVEKIQRLKKMDNRIGIGDLLNIAIFFHDKQATKFITFSKDIINSKKIANHLKDYRKTISTL
jgi:predicted nucleic acid-binding protein